MPTTSGTPTSDGARDRPTVAFADGVALPLVSLLVINWNYAGYVGAAIDSLQAQDYPELEIVVVDNGSTDHSREVIAAHLEGDRRCRTVHLGRNLGQLGAFCEVAPSLAGDFVTIVDADDTLSPHFVSTHVQAHLALASNVALTSSNIVEMDSMGRALTGHYEAFGHAFPPAATGLRRIDRALRVPTVTDEQYRDLARSISVYLDGGRWMWGPGTSTMYRRSVLDLVHHSPPGRTWFRAADNFLNPLCHLFGGSALIDQPLSAYRVHGGNSYAQRETLAGIQKGKAGEVERIEQRTTESLGIFLGKVDRYRPVLEGRFWSAFDQLCTALRDPTGRLVASPAVVAALGDHYRLLVDVLGESDVLDHLEARLTPRDLYRVLQRARGRRLPSLTMLRHEASPTRARAERAVRIAQRYRHIPVRETPRTLLRDVKRNLLDPGMTDPAPAPVDPGPSTTPVPPVIGYADRVGYGPCSVLSVDPPVFFTGIAFREFVGIAGAFGRRYGNRPAAFIVYPTWTIASPDRASAVIAAARAHQARYPDHRLVYACNTAEERDRLAEGGLAAILLNKNCIVPEQVFRPLDGVEVEFDAVYNARFDPNKRHELAGDIDLLAYLSYDDPAGTDETRQQQRQLIATLAARHPQHVLINPTDDGLPVRLPANQVNLALNRAAVGLCLSAVEGANYASVEYLLAGLPIVSTPSTGGRDVYFDPEFCTICDPDAAAVRQAVERLRSRHIPRQYIRERTLATLEPHRRRFLSLIDDLTAELGGRRRYDDGRWPFSSLAELVSWDEHGAHLARFELADRPGSRPEPDATIEQHLNGTTDIQLQLEELRPIVDAIRSRPGCSLLVFGCGNDSVFWERVNHGGTTTFVEDDPKWAEQTATRLDRARVHLVTYGTTLDEWPSLLHRPGRLELALPPEVADRRYDVVVVDAPAGYKNHFELTGRVAPGRMQSIFAASRLVAPDGYVFVHDCDRPAEQAYATEYLGADRLFVRARGRALLQGYGF